MLGALYLMQRRNIFCEVYLIMCRVAVIGHFGIGLNLANGQTIKTKIVTEAVEKNIEEKVLIIDAHGGVKAICPVAIGCIRALRKSENIILMLTENGLKVSVPVLSLFNRLFNKRIHYVVIGGWLPKFLEKQKRLEKQLKNFYKIYVETNTMKNSLEAKGFQNVVVMPNCKKLTILDEKNLVYQQEEPLKICTFSRVMKEKGIEVLTEVVKEINSNKKHIELDIYGQVDSQQTAWFENLKNQFPEYIHYGGVVPFDKSVEILRNYFMLVFPTLFYTEGVPGTIIDGYAAGIPVLAARWESFSDVIDENESGIGYKFGDKNALKETLLYCVDNIQKINNMKKYCLSKSEEFNIEQAMKILFSNLI